MPFATCTFSYVGISYKSLIDVNGNTTPSCNNILRAIHACVVADFWMKFPVRFQGIHIDTFALYTLLLGTSVKTEY